MELYTLDGQLKRTEIVEGYESFIWTERYSELGDLSIVTPATQQYRNLLASGTAMGLSESRRVMKIETISDTVDDDGNKTLTCSGKEIMAITQDRVATTGLPGVEAGTWTSTGKPSDIIRALFDFVCRNGFSGTGDQLPLLDPGSLYAAGNIPEDTTVYTIERRLGSLFTTIKEIADVWDLGFRMYKGDDDGKLYFDVYKGNDRTTSQTLLPAVIFSESLDSLQNVSELTSVAKSKNVAWVDGKYGTRTIYSQGASITTTGFNKRILFVDGRGIEYEPRTNTLGTATEQAINKAIALKEALDYQKIAMRKLIDKVRFAAGEASVVTSFTTAMVSGALLTAGEKTAIDNAVTASTALEAAETTAYQAALDELGTQELAKNRSISAFDGEITQLSPYKYKRDYDMGDLVEMRSSTGLTNQMLVTEQIFVSDLAGERAYPTLTMKLFITPGSWLAWENTQVWLDAPGTWATS